MRRSAGSADGDNDYRSLLLNTLDRIGCGGLILDRNQKLISANAVAVEILKRRNLPTEGSSFTSAVEELLRSLSASSAHDEAAWVTAWRDYEQPLAVFRVPSNEANHVILVLVDIQTRLQPNARVLRQMFGLTSAKSTRFRNCSGVFTGGLSERSVCKKRQSVLSWRRFSAKPRRIGRLNWLPCLPYRHIA